MTEITKDDWPAVRKLAAELMFGPTAAGDAAMTQCSPDTIEAIVASAMAWHPSENGPSHGEAKETLLKRLAALRPSSAGSASGWLEGKHGGTYRRLTAIRDGAQLEMPTARAIADALDSLLYSSADPAQTSPLQQAFNIIQANLSSEIKSTLKTPDDARQAIQNWLSMNTFEGK